MTQREKRFSLVGAALSKTLHGMKVVQFGSPLSQESLINIKTVTSQELSDIDWADMLSQSFLSQTPSLYIGIHNNGTVERIEKCRLDEAFMIKSEVKISKDVVLLRLLLLKLRQSVNDLGEEKTASGKLSLVCNDGQLALYARNDAKSCFPEQLSKLFRDPYHFF